MKKIKHLSSDGKNVAMSHIDTEAITGKTAAFTKITRHSVGIQKKREDMHMALLFGR